MATYYEKLQDPRWQRKRLEIMERDGFKCRRCATTSKTLTVHHGYYGRKMEPWDYGQDTLWTLCLDCHDVVQSETEAIHRFVAAKHPVDLKNVFSHLTEISNTEQITAMRQRAAACATAYIVRRAVFERGLSSELVEKAITLAYSTAKQFPDALKNAIDAVLEKQEGGVAVG